MGILQEDVEGDVGAVPACGLCGSERVVRGASVCWNPETGLWEIETVFDHARCQACDGETTLVWTHKDPMARTRVRELNDRFRQNGEGPGTIVITQGVEAHGAAFLRQACAMVHDFDAFSEDNDPWGTHDFGSFEIDGEKLFWKIDAYDRSMQFGSPNPANPAVTHRVLTILLASEY